MREKIIKRLESDQLAVKKLRLSAQNLSKSFGSNCVLNNASLAIMPGEIHALVGQNGSGKSTLIKILSGHYSPKSGASLEIDGVRINFPVKISELRATGVSVLHQDFGLVDEFSIMENIRITNFSCNSWTRSIKWSHEREVVAELLRELNCKAHPSMQVGALGPVDRAKVAIARALQSARSTHEDKGISLLIFDESTRALPRDALEEFYGEISKLVDAGTSVLLVSHSIEEVMKSADRVTVLRDGEVLASGLSTDETTEEDLVELMLGYGLNGVRQKKIISTTKDFERNAFVVSKVSGRTVKEVDIEIYPGEILGLTGLEGSGFEEIPYILSGARPALAGTLTIKEHTLPLPTTSTHEFIKSRIFLVPERRETEGLAFGQSISQNITLPRVRERGNRFNVGTRWEQEEALTAIKQFGITPPHAGVLVGRLSGGNQQKVLLGKWFLGQPNLLFLHEPTQGVDVGARRDIVNAIVALAESGVAVVVATIELGLLEELCARVIIFRNGQIRSIVTKVLIQTLVDEVYQNITMDAKQNVDSKVAAE